MKKSRSTRSHFTHARSCSRALNQVPTRAKRPAFIRTYSLWQGDIFPYDRFVTRKTIVRKNISLSQRIRPDESRSFRTRRNLIERAWTTSRMRKVGSSRPWLFHIFQLRALIFSLPVGEFFSNFWWQLRSIGCVSIPIFKKFCRWEKILKSNSWKLGFYFLLSYRIFLKLHILTIIPNNM